MEVGFEQLALTASFQQSPGTAAWHRSEPAVGAG